MIYSGQEKEVGRTKTIEFVEKIMNLMEEEGLTQGQVAYVLKALPEEIEKNSERLKKSKPFTVFKGTNNSGQCF